MKLEELTELGLADEAAEKLLKQMEADLESRLEAERKKLPRVLAATPGGSFDPELHKRFAAMGYSQRLAMKKENPALYRELTENK